MKWYTKALAVQGFSSPPSAAEERPTEWLLYLNKKENRNNKDACEYHYFC